MRKKKDDKCEEGGRKKGRKKKKTPSNANVPITQQKAQKQTLMIK